MDMSYVCNVIEVIDFKSEVRSDLRGCFEAVLASKFLRDYQKANSPIPYVCCRSIKPDPCYNRQPGGGMTISSGLAVLQLRDEH